MLGGGGLVAVNVYASASDGGGSGQGGPTATGQIKSAGMATIDCPDVGTKLTDVPEAARADVDRELSQLDQQTAGAYRQLQQSAPAVREDPGSADGTIMNPLKEKRAATIQRIADAIDKAGNRPEGLESLAACTLRPGEGGDTAGAGRNGAAPSTSGQDQNGGDQKGGGQNGGGRPGTGQAGTGQGGNGPVASDYQDITSVQPNVSTPAPQADASRGSFTSDCGVNANGLRNSDNVITSPGVTNGAHHFHDYIGNQSNNAFASDDDLEKADTSCVDKGDKSTYYWPVLRLQNGKQERDAGAPGGGTEGNAGQIVTPKEVTLTFVGNARGKVTAMPRLLRIITGDAKAFVNGPANANASWSCTGYEDRQLKDKYPLCPAGSDVVRSFHFQSCWDGRNTDSANHRTHMAFEAPDGSCPAGFEPVPQLVQRIVYDVDAPSLKDGGRTVPLFAVDSFPEQLHKPVTDHGDFIAIFDDGLMRQMVDCINSGRTCGPGGDSGATTAPDPGASSGAGPTAGASEPPRAEASTSPAGPGRTTAPGRTRHTGHPKATETANGGDSGKGAGTGKGTGNGTSGDSGKSSGSGNSSGAGVSDGAGKSGGSGNSDGSGAAGDSATTGKTTEPGRSDEAGAGSTQTAAGGEVGQATQTPQTITPTGQETPPPVAQTEPQGTQGGGLADTGAHLWPAAIGILLALSGLVLFLRARRSTY
ncbi:DUF1996 domain-containing protein [Streptomyces sp. L2]|uniref:DUF1996 domain-containing protein n=1 Tax=Streptomyces sp. L2 TaxID=2162665 RepID=UPI001012FA6B|nr:DUF1996 domain-containing protein [Streptomyces sp. L2]